MFKILFALHLLTAIFAIGPLVHASTTAVRGLRTADAGATATAARTITIYAYASLLVVFFGFGLMSMDDPYGPGKVAEISEPYIWVSALLWVVAVGLALGVLVPALETATTRIGAGESVDTLRGKVAAPGGVIGLIFAGIVFLMVYKPGS
ncbi:MAG: hypothetical protein NTV23_11465 [Propionibacteriales bacterium]|nr:hypothetical protein [Propionibacteriales bacterium]